MEQFSRSNYIESFGVRKELNENVFSAFKQIGIGLGVNINETNIDACHRLCNHNVPEGIDLW